MAVPEAPTEGPPAQALTVTADMAALGISEISLVVLVALSVPEVTEVVVPPAMRRTIISGQQAITCGTATTRKREMCWTACRNLREMPDGITTVRSPMPDLAIR